MSLKSVRDEYEAGVLSKPDFIECMNQCHGTLFEYADYMKETGIRKIEIRDGDVVLTARVSNARFMCKRGDMRLPQIEALNFGAYEPDEAAMMYRLIQPGMTVFDIGANIGWFSIHFAMLHETVRVHAFEPVADTYSWLAKNVALNEVPNLNHYNFGLGTEPGDVEFFVYPEGSGGSSMADNSKRETVSKIKCHIETLDGFCTEKSIVPDFIKCDVEGAELFVYQGGEKMIADHNPIVFTEMLRKWAASFNYHPDEIIQWFLRLGYACYEIAGERLSPFRKMDENTASTNFIFLHEEHHRDVIQELT